MAKILYGKPVREKMALELKAKIEGVGVSPKLAIIQVGNREDSTAYIKQKQKFGAEIGVEVMLKNLEMEEGLIKEIEKLNQDESITGIIVQLPLPPHLDAARAVQAIAKEKDADGLREAETEGEGPLVTPATARAVLSLLDYYDVQLQDKNIAVIGRSRLAGGPIAEVLRGRGAMVTVCHKETPNTAEICRGSDVLISAAGQVGLVTKDFVNRSQVVIDVGINRVDGKLVGDVLFAEVEPIVAAISPVPGGVGPLTVACLFQNLLDLCYNEHN